MARAMKDSGIEWIGQIPEEWQYQRLKNFYSFEKGKNAALYTQEYIGQHAGEYPVYSGQTENDGIMGKIDSYDYDISECLFTTTVGAKVMTPKILRGKFCLSQNCLIMKSIADTDNHYIFFLLEALFGYEKSLIPSYMQPSLRIEDLKKYSFFAPLLSEQQKIANFLDSKCASIDAVIEKTKASIEEYKKLKQAIITQAVTKGIRPNRKMKDSGIEWIGEIPDEWDCVISRFVIDKVGDINHYMPDSVEVGYPYLMIGDLCEMTSKINFDNCKKISEKDYFELCEKIKPKEGDVIFARYATIGTVCYVDTNNDFLVSYACVTIVPSKKKLLGKYLFYYFKSTSFLEDVRQYINSNTQGNVGIEALNKTKITVPPLTEQSQIISFLDLKCYEVETIIQKKEMMIQKLDTYKKSLIYEYVTGKKEVV